MAGSIADPALVARFAQALARLNPEGGRIGLAVSGGPDSMAMLLLAQATIPGEFEVATVDHGLRPEARGECALVESACEERGIPCAVLPVTVGKGNVQAQARAARYAALCAWADRGGLAALATAHHADDQAETLLMRLNRGSGVAGLAGVREKHRPAGFKTAIFRPLLGFRRAELAALIERAGLRVAADPSNSDRRFDRVRIRQAVADAEWLDPLALSRSASNLAETDAALARLTDEIMRDRVRREGDGFACDALRERVLAHRVVERIIARFGGAPRGGDVARLLDRLEGGSGGNLAGVLVTVEGKGGPAEGPRWVFRPEPPRRSG